jgi:hypothetical protein
MMHLKEEREKYIPPISVILHLLRLACIGALAEPDLEIRAGAEDAAVARDYDALDAVVDVEHCIRRFDLLAHRVREGIVFAWAVERKDDDAGLFVVVACLDLRELQIVVRGWKHNVGFVARRLVVAGWHCCECEELRV